MANQEDEHHPGEEANHGVVPPLHRADLVVCQSVSLHGADDAGVEEAQHQDWDDPFKYKVTLNGSRMYHPLEVQRNLESLINCHLV